MRGLQRFASREAPAPMQEAAQRFETRYAVSFSDLMVFPADTLEALHAPGPDDSALLFSVTSASQDDDAVKAAIDLLTQTANRPFPSHAERFAYYEALQFVYRRLNVADVLDGKHLVVAPEREGRILAESLGWLRPGRDVAPHAKRIPYDHGLLVGVSRRERRLVEQGTLVCIDGAIASGATLIALLEQYASPSVPIEIYSVHAAREGLRAILRYARMRRLSVRLRVGHVTEGLSSKFYAVQRENQQLVVGDLGDMIATLAVPVAPS